VRPTRTILAAFSLVAACAGPAAAPGPGAPPLPPATALPQPPAPAARSVARGATAEEARRILGAPARVERVPSATVAGLAYERWIYADGREVVIAGGKVLDVTP
jgi:hypothetical protein